MNEPRQFATPLPCKEKPSWCCGSKDARCDRIVSPSLICKITVLSAFFMHRLTNASVRRSAIADIENINRF